MKKFHISDVLTVTTGRLVSSRHMDGVYDILNYITGDNLFTHQLPRAARECEPWLAAQYPYLMENSPEMQPHMERLKADLQNVERDDKTKTVAAWVEAVREAFGLPEMIPIYEMGEDMHTHIDPIEELQAMTRKPILIHEVGEE